MQILPAIDLLDGECVRLHKGDFGDVQRYGADPVAVAAGFQAEGARTLHLVDLSGAQNPALRQTELIRRVIAETGLEVQTGGGIRTKQDVETLLLAGARRVVIGSLAVKDPVLTRAIFSDFGAEHICLAMDVMPDGKEYRIAVSGWQEASRISLWDMTREYEDTGFSHLLCTDISRDGTLQGPNIRLYQKLAERAPRLSVQASGGVGTLADIAALSGSGADAAIVGKALYEGRFSLAEALAQAGAGASPGADMGSGPETGSEAGDAADAGRNGAAGDGITGDNGPC